eukprot:44518-Eustigmatos_ZCMA.PRE.1
MFCSVVSSASGDNGLGSRNVVSWSLGPCESPACDPKMSSVRFLSSCHSSSKNRATAVLIGTGLTSCSTMVLWK